MSDEVKTELTGMVEGLWTLARAICEGDEAAMIDWYGSDEFADNEYDPSEIHDRIRGDSVSHVDTEIVKSLVFAGGGPHVELDLVLTGEGEPKRAVVNGYWGGEQVRRQLSSDDAYCLADYFGITT